MRRSAAYALAGFGAINVVFIVVSIATSSWLSLFGTGVFSIWDTGDSAPAELKLTRAFMIIGLFVQFAAVVFCLLLAHQKSDKKVYGIVLFSVSGIFLFIALVVFAAEFGDLVSYGYSYILGWIASILSLILSASVEFLSRYK